MGVILWTCLRALGVAVVLMPVTTGGLAGLDPELTNSGRAFNNVVQRVGAALGLAALSVLVTTQQAELLAGRGNIIQAAALQQSRLGLSGMYQFYINMNLEVLTNSIGNMLIVATWITLLSAVLALFLPARHSHR